MKKRMMMIATLALAIYNIVLAGDKVTINDFRISAGETKEVYISLVNDIEYVAFQFDLYLPEGITLESYCANRERIPETTTLSMRQQEDGAYRFISAAMEGAPLVGYDGTIVTLTVKASESLSHGSLTGYFRKVKLSKADATGPTYSEMDFSITVIEPSVVTVTSVSREYGKTNPTFEYTVTGGALDGEPEITCPAKETSSVGKYPINISKGTVTNFNVIYVNGILTIEKAPLTITAKSYTITQGDALPTFDAEYSGFKNDETADVLNKKPILTTSVTSSSEPGTFDIVASGAEAQNYEISYVKGTLTINPGVYKLTYMVDGEIYKTYDVVYGTAITPEAEPTKEGYTFSGWSEIPATMPAHDVTITGSFTKGAYKLTYMLDGVVYKTISYDYGDAITPEPAPTKEGYTFSGWSEIPATMPAHDVTVTGTFSINKYKLTYIVDGVEYKSYDIEYGATITPEVEPTKDGYTFSGWSEIPATMPAHDVTVTGTFTLDTGIEQIMSNANVDVMIFTIDGKRVDNLKKGMNVIRMKDGTTRKVVVK